MTHDFELKGVWCGPGDCGKTLESARAFLDRLKEHGFNAIFINLKGGDGKLFWPSPGFSDAVAEGYRNFDLPAVLLEECGKRGIQFHSWFIDYYEGENGVAYKAHPEWAVRDWKGRTTAEETLRGKRYSSVWMCPARRPGYTDQWLVPLYKEFAERYPVASLHHDYIRYPGDLAPDQYCFCDYCLENLPKWAGYISEKYPDEPFYHELYDREYLEAHWEQSPRVLPRNWERLDRGSKSRFLLEGGFFRGGRNDLDYYFYRYRIEAVTRFAKESHEAVKAANPHIKLSGAYFKNPIHSGRFIGQDWREHAPYCEICVPMDYRDHFPGSFEQYLDLLEETIYKQQGWTKTGPEPSPPTPSSFSLREKGEGAFEKLYIGFAVNFLFKEEPNGPYPPEKFRKVVERIASTGSKGLVVFCAEQLERFGMWEVARETMR